MWVLMAAHTPGPWRYQGEDPYGGWNVDADSLESGDYIAWLPDHDREGEGQANAHLTAAAPELLEACKVALSWIHPTDAGSIRARCLREAIAKAEGGNE